MNGLRRRYKKHGSPSPSMTRPRLYARRCDAPCGMQRLYTSHAAPARAVQNIAPRKLHVWCLARSRERPSPRQMNMTAWNSQHGW